jgi:hypothetical protein
MIAPNQTESIWLLCKATPGPLASAAVTAAAAQQTWVCMHVNSRPGCVCMSTSVHACGTADLGVSACQQVQKGGRAFLYSIHPSAYQTVQHVMRESESDVSSCESESDVSS